MIKVSIIIPLYNSEKYLKECIESVVSQTIFNEIELILVNDGSTDNSENICLGYSQKYNNIKYFYQKNNGVSSARNFGISKAKGQYLYFLDSDDTINDIFIESAYNNAIFNNSDIVIVGVNYFFKEPIIPKNVIGCNTWQTVIKKALLDKFSELRFNEKISLGEDNLFTLQCLFLADKISIERKSLYYYRDTENSITQKEKCDNLYFIQEREKILFSGLEPFYKNYKNAELEQRILRYTSHYYFWRILSWKFSFKEKFLVCNIIKKFIKENSFTFIRIDFRRYKAKFNFLYLLFNCFYFYIMNEDIYEAK